MVELHHLMKVLGRRPSAEGSHALHKFAPRKLDRSGGLGAQFDPATRTSVSGLTLSSSLSEMLPSEAVLLRGTLWRLFLAKKAESKLLSYELSGWADVMSVPHTRPRYNPRLPSAPGGPLVVCLDTSWSISGTREWLSKAVVLACVTAAHKQSRKCQVVAFSNEHGVMDAGEIVANASGVQRLLDSIGLFVEFVRWRNGCHWSVKVRNDNSGPGYDVGSRLTPRHGRRNPDPPVSEDVMEDLDHLKRRTPGMQIHGLLVGKSESKPLTRLCTETHEFLIGYDMLAAVASPTVVAAGYPSSSALSSLPSCKQSCRAPSPYAERFHRRVLSKRVHASDNHGLAVDALALYAAISPSRSMQSIPQKWAKMNG